MLFVAEIGLCHNGNFDLACEMMRQSMLSGADIVKMQLGWRDKQGEINHIDEAVLNKLFRYAEFLEIELMFSVFHADALNLIKKFPIIRYKIASRTVKDDLSFVKRVVDDGKEVIISLGMWDKEELPIVAKNVKYLWCKAIYPTMPWDMIDFPKNFSSSGYHGYSDHTLGIDSALLAISRGARMVEKHFTLDKSDTTIRDHVLAASPSEFNDMVTIGRAMAKKIKMGV